MINNETIIGTIMQMSIYSNHIQKSRLKGFESF